ncbi:MAG TPA: dihydrofolate reductase family protein [Gemmatimonadaceae bacterium]|nr:dihydrofolate reductase family protein [Gemmatimonadaceae bacterium]
MRCSVFIAISLDGFIARSDGAIDWLSIVEREREDHGFAAFFESIDTVVMGRKTWQIALGFDPWPYAKKRVVVLSHEPRHSSHGEEFWSGDAAALLDTLNGSRRIYADGGTVIAQLLAADRIDDLTISIVPILLGAGTPLSPAIGRDIRLRLTKHRTFESGLVQLQYAIAR